MDGAKSLAVIVQSGGFDHVHYALVMASTAAATGRRTVLFFTGRALRALAGPQGWLELDRGDDGTTPASRNAAMRAAGVGDFETLLSACAELGVRFIACEMGMRLAGLRHDQLRKDFDIEQAGMATLLNAADGPIVHV
ncbi:MAG TPA: DsrE/DsrF/DrsH-like family protein [Azospirillaceae bacterium]|nr:DsrE/DsrF/DrsH-like family protein [Azospirillaceae bacterium]